MYYFSRLYVCIYIGMYVITDTSISSSYKYLSEAMHVNVVHVLLAKFLQESTFIMHSFQYGQLQPQKSNRHKRHQWLQNGSGGTLQQLEIQRCELFPEALLLDNYVWCVKYRTLHCLVVDQIVGDYKCTNSCCFLRTIWSYEFNSFCIHTLLCRNGYYWRW
jgi:hypothetical protein